MPGAIKMVEIWWTELKKPSSRYNKTKNKEEGTSTVLKKTFWSKLGTDPINYFALPLILMSEPMELTETISGTFRFGDFPKILQ